MILTTEINRSDSEVTQVICFIDEIKINEVYSFNPELIDFEINNYIRTNLITKGYQFE